MKKPVNIKSLRFFVGLLNRLLVRFNIKYQFLNLNTIILYVNNTCNATCLMCDVGQKEGKGCDQLLVKNGGDMPLEMVKKILDDSYVRKNRFYFQLIMVEPLLNKDIIKIINLIKKGCHTVDLKTNGFLLEEKADELSKTSLDSLQISLDGPEEVHDKIRGIKVYRKALDGLRLLISKNPKIYTKVNCTVSNLNYQYLTRFVKELNSENILLDELKIQYMNFITESMAQDQNETYKFKRSEMSVSKVIHPESVDIETLYKNINDVKEMKLQNIKHVTFIPNITDKRTLSEYFSKDGKRLDKYAFCITPFNQIAIKTNGDILFHFTCFDYIVGNVNEDLIAEAFDGESARLFRTELKKADYCFPVCTRCCGGTLDKFPGNLFG